jgi:hypothetical protein
VQGILVAGSEMPYSSIRRETNTKVVSRHCTRAQIGKRSGDCRARLDGLHVEQITTGSLLHGTARRLPGYARICTTVRFWKVEPFVGCMKLIHGTTSPRKTLVVALPLDLKVVREPVTESSRSRVPTA